MGCGVVRRHGSDLVLLWLWCRPAAVVLIQPRAWKLLYPRPAAPLKKKKKKKKRWKRGIGNIFKRENKWMSPTWGHFLSANKMVKVLLDSSLSLHDTFLVGRLFSWISPLIVWPSSLVYCLYWKLNLQENFYAFILISVTLSPFSLLIRLFRIMWLE